MKEKTAFTALIAAIVTFMVACKSDNEDNQPTVDKQLFDEVNASGFTYYRSGTILSPEGNSPHGSFKLRFNNVANAALDTSGELPSGNSFPSGSIIVKEAYNSSSELELYAVMKKDAGNTYAGSGWLWAELNKDGTTRYSVTKKGDACISCHSGSTNRDLVRTFDLH